MRDFWNYDSGVRLEELALRAAAVEERHLAARLQRVEQVEQM